MKLLNLLIITITTFMAFTIAFFARSTGGTFFFTRSYATWAIAVFTQIVCQKKKGINKLVILYWWQLNLLPAFTTALASNRTTATKKISLKFILICLWRYNVLKWKTYSRMIAAWFQTAITDQLSFIYIVAYANVNG